MRILLIEDDNKIAGVILKSLRNEGFTCDYTDQGEDAMCLIKLYSYDCILLDLMLPDMEGSEVIRRIRATKIQTPIIITSAIDQTAEIIKTLNFGADDYINKPCHLKELVARLYAVTRRNMGYYDSKITFGRLSVNLQTKTAKADGMPLKLTNKEYSILELLILKRGHTLSKDAFLSNLYDESGEEPAQKIVDVFICKLRNKLKKALNSNKVYIETIWGRGYTLVDPDSQANTIEERAVSTF